MARRKGLSDAAIAVALKAIEEQIKAGIDGEPVAASVDEAQALFDARRELMTIGNGGAAPKPAAKTRTTRTRTTTEQPNVE